MSVSAVIIAPIVAMAATGIIKYPVFIGERYSLSDVSQTGGNLYVVAGDSTISGTVNGDLTSANGNLILLGKVNGDVLVAGGQLHIAGPVTGDVRLIGGQIGISAPVGGDLAVAGGDVMVDLGTSVGGNAMIAGGKVWIEGVLNGPLHAAGGEVYLNGVINGDVAVTTGKFSVGPLARIKGNLHYESPREGVIDPGAVISGKIEYTEGTYRGGVAEGLILGFIAIFSFLKLLMMLTLGLVAFWLVRPKLQEVITDSLAKFGPELLRGFIIAVVLPVVIVLLFITIIGIPLGILGLLVGMGFGLMAKAFAGILFGAWAQHHLFKKGHSKLSWMTVVFGIVALYALSMIPVFGWILYMVFTFVVFGTLCINFYRHGKDKIF